MKLTWLIPVLAGCALTSKSQPVEIRHFSPAASDARATPSAPAGLRARLGRITSSTYLRYRIAHRRSPVEVELSDTLRWTEHPDEYVRRALSRSLFDERGVEQVVVGDAATLNVEVTAFEHVVRNGRHFGRVQLRYTIEGDRDVLDDGVATVEREARGADITLVVAAIGAALDAASADVADRVVRELRSVQ
jgi:cholesterol transport system auxiliary component